MFSFPRCNDINAIFRTWKHAKCDENSSYITYFQFQCALFSVRWNVCNLRISTTSNVNEIIKSNFGKLKENFPDTSGKLHCFSYFFFFFVSLQMNERMFCGEINIMSDDLRKMDTKKSNSQQNPSSVWQMIFLLFSHIFVALDIFIFFSHAMPCHHIRIRQTHTEHRPHNNNAMLQKWIQSSSERICH